MIRLVVMMDVKYPLSLPNVEDLLFERGIDICHETVRLWWNRFGPMFAAEWRCCKTFALIGYRAQGSQPSKVDSFASSSIITKVALSPSE